MLLSRGACALLSTACKTPSLAAAVSASSRIDSSSKAYSSDSRRGRTAGELGDDAAQSMQGAEDKAAGTGDKAEPRVAQGGFVPEADTVLSPETAGRAGDIGADIMGDMMDAMNAAVKGDDKRAAADVADMVRHQNSDVHTSSHIKPPYTTTQDWPRGSIADPAAAPASSSQSGADSAHIGEAPFVNTDEAHAACINRYEGTIPRVDPSEELPEVDQDPPESVTAGPTPGYAARGGDTHPV